jgi:hypothetical protein
MAKTHFVFGYVAGKGSATPAPAMITDADLTAMEEKAPTGANAVTAAAAKAANKSVWGNQPICRVATDTQVYVSFGANPNALTDGLRFLMPANSVEYFYVKAGDKAAVVTG